MLKSIRPVVMLVVVATILASGNLYARSSQVIKKDILRQVGPPNAASVDSVYDLVFDWPLLCGFQQTGVINAHFNAFGSFSSCSSTLQYFPERPAPLFETPAYSYKEYLFSAAIWVGGIVNGDTLVSVGADGWLAEHEFYPPAGQGVTKLESMADYSMRAVSADTITQYRTYNHEPLNISLSNRSHVWRSTPYENAIIYDLVITNFGKEQISEGFCGVYVDADVFLSSIPYGSGFDDDLSGSMREHGLAYVIDNDGDPLAGSWDEATSLRKIFAFKFLSASFEPTDTSYNWWISNGNPALDFGPRKKSDSRDFGTGGTGTPIGDANKYYLMSSGDWDYDQCFTASIDSLDPIWQYPTYPTIAQGISDGADTKFLMSIGPFDLAPGESVRIQFAMFTADSIHSDPTNFLSNIQTNYDPDSYLANLNLNHLLPNAEAAAEKASFLLDPMLPATGLTVLRQEADSVYLEWDSWTYNADLEGYDLYLTQIDLATLPHPGVIPPWWDYELPNFYASVGTASKGSLTDLDTTAAYVAHVSHRSSGGTGQLSQPVIIHPYPDGVPGPNVSLPVVFCPVGGGTVLISWETSANAVDHYNIYKFTSDTAANRAYHSFYSVYDTSSTRDPIDQIEVNGVTYYYYAMQPYQSTDAGVSSIEVDVVDGDFFRVSTVAADGWESGLSDNITAREISEPTKDVLLIYSGGILLDQHHDTVFNYYSTILSDLNLEFDESDYSVPDICALRDCKSLQEWTQYKLVIVDDGSRGTSAQLLGPNMLNYLRAGGKLATFGNQGLIPATSPNLEWREKGSSWGPMDSYLSSYFGIDSGLCVSTNIYHDISQYPNIPESDTLFGFRRAETQTSQFPSIDGDPNRYPKSHFIWPDDAPPGVTIYAPSPGAITTHLFRSIHPETSLFEGFPTGVKTVIDDAYGHHETYTFGFHLYFMQQSDARDVIRTLLDLQPCCGLATDGFTGNTNCDAEGLRNIVDITTLIDRIYLSKTQLCCEPNGNVNGDPENKINLSDITALIDHVYISKAQSAACE